jgi:hypothetical protein
VILKVSSVYNTDHEQMQRTSKLPRKLQFKMDKDPTWTKSLKLAISIVEIWIYSFLSIRFGSVCNTWAIEDYFLLKTL